MILITIRDITERKQAEEALMSDILWTIDINLNITYVSPSVEKVLAFSVKEGMGQPIGKYMLPEAFLQASDRLIEELAYDDEKDPERQLPISIIMADLTGLKLVNDTYGHLTGDIVLKCAAKILRNICREDDLLARFGGDDFILYYRDKLTESRSSKSTVVNSLLQTLAAKSFQTEAHTRNMHEAAKSIGEKLGLPTSELRRLRLLITLHDIGKINIPEELRTKKGTLSASE